MSTFGLCNCAKIAALTAILSIFPRVASAGCSSAGFPPSRPAMPAEVAGALPDAAPDLSPSMDQASPSMPTIVGLWSLNFISEGQVVDVAFDAWHSDRTEVLNDYTNPINGNVCLGVWEQTGPYTYKLKHPSWSFDGSGNLLGTVIIRETVHLSGEGNSFSGNYTYDIYDTSGNFQQQLSGQVQAKRITLD